MVWLDTHLRIICIGGVWRSIKKILEPYDVSKAYFTSGKLRYRTQDMYHSWKDSSEHRKV